MSSKVSALTPRHRRFIQEYLVDDNATQAAIRCGYSKKTAGQQGARLLKDARIWAAVQELQAQRYDRNELKADRVLEELRRLAFSDVRGLFDEKGRLLPPNEWSREAAAAVAGFEVVTKQAGQGEVEYVAKVKSWDKTSTLTTLARYFKLLVDRHEVTGKDGGPVETAVRVYVPDNARGRR